jgi:hypothetical protein
VRAQRLDVQPFDVRAIRPLSNGAHHLNRARRVPAGFGIIQQSALDAREAVEDVCHVGMRRAGLALEQRQGFHRTRLRAGQVAVVQCRERIAVKRDGTVDG